MPFHKKLRHSCLIILQWSISIIALLYACSGIEFLKLISNLEKYSVIGILLTLAMVLIEYVFISIRLRFLLTNSITIHLAFKATMLGSVYNLILPAKAGDIIKLGWLCKIVNLRVVDVTPAIIWERVWDIFIVVFLLLSLFFFESFIESSSIPFIILISIFIIFILSRRNSIAIQKFYWNHLPMKIRKPFIDLHRNLIDKPTLKSLCSGCIISFIILILHYLSFWFALNHIANLNLGLDDVFFAVIITSIGNAIPSAPGNIGVFEGSMVWALSQLKIAHELVFGIAIVLHAIYLFPPILYFLLIHLKLFFSNLKFHSRI